MLRHRLTSAIVIADTSIEETSLKGGTTGRGRPRLTGPTIATPCRSCICVKYDITVPTTTYSVQSKESFVIFKQIYNTILTY